jgi:hypothetical protein
LFVVSFTFLLLPYSMSVKQSDYEELLAQYSDRCAAIALLKQHRPYLEMIPSMRRPEESAIAIPLPVVRIRQKTPPAGSNRLVAAPGGAISLPCDVAFLMCDPEWKIKMGVEIFVFIHRPHEDFSDLLSRWRQTQVLLDNDYEWLMPPRYQHMLSEGADGLYPLFVLFSQTPERIKRGLTGASLPFVIQTPVQLVEEYQPETLSAPTPPA